MKRRQFAGASAVFLAAAGAGSGWVSLAGGRHQPYSREVYEQALASGKPFMLDFYANW